MSASLSPQEAYQELLSLTRELSHLQAASHLLHWDQEVMMPKKGAHQRSEQLAALQKIIHERSTSPRLGELLDSLKETGDLDNIACADIREARRNYDRTTKVPVELAVELARLQSVAVGVWSRAREEKNFAAFAPTLNEVLERTREYADAIRGDKSRYDALLDEFEPNETEANLKRVFAELRESIVPLLQGIQDSENKPESAVLQGHYPASGQETLCLQLIKAIGYDLDGGRLDTTVHPFCTGSGGDVRITTRYNEADLTDALFGALHEAGHALYEQGLNRERVTAPSGIAASTGIHESQSRWWENMIGRSRSFWQHFYPVLREHFNRPFGSLSLDEYLGAINHVAPSFVRVEADEVTYNLHIILRFSIEQEMVSGVLDVKDLPERWNTQFQQDFGLTPPDDSLGCLQDIHWSCGLIGYFPTYALGNLYAAQFYETADSALGGIDNLVMEGNFAPILDWLRTNIHDQGRLHYAPELCEAVTGRSLSSEPFLRYIRNKYKAYYSGLR